MSIPHKTHDSTAMTRRDMTPSIYAFAMTEGGSGATPKLLYVGRAREGATTLRTRWQQHLAGRGNPTVAAALRESPASVLYQCLPLTGMFEDAAVYEAAVLRDVKNNTGQLPPGNTRGEEGTKASPRVLLGLSRHEVVVCKLTAVGIGAGLGGLASTLGGLAASGRLG
mmetsp:Transcript_21164/g.50202  ORF Transcript_21164/g.50202 Transcript_21164/m.50202 type:complete len:168 (-) Transcript_21164:39-542(-)